MPPRADEVILNSYPYPLARSYQRATRSTRDDTLIHDYLMDLFEMTVKYLAIAVMAQYTNDPDANDERINQSLLGISRPSLGMWVGWMRDITRYYEKQKRPLVVSELPAFISTKFRNDSKKGKTEQEPIVRCYYRVREMLQEMGRGEADNSTVFTMADFYDAILQYRNSIAHGANPSPLQKRELVSVMLPGFEAMLLQMEFIARYRLVFVNTVSRAPSREKRYEHYYTELYGDTPYPRRDPKTTDNDDPSPETLYLCSADQEYAPLLSLRPFMIFRVCQKHGNEETFVLNEGRENDLAYLSYQCGHAFKLTEYVDDLNALIRGVGGHGIIGEVQESQPALPAVTSTIRELADLPAQPPAKQEPPASQPRPSDPPPIAPPPPPPLAEGYREAQPSAQMQTQPNLQPTPPPQSTPQPTPSRIFCTNCGTANPPNRKFCANCGNPMTRTSQPLPGSQTNPAGPLPPQAQTRRCPNCNHDNALNRKFCANCGFRLM